MTYLHAAAPVAISPPAAKADCHLAIELGPFAGRERALLNALLRVDLGARIKLDAGAGKVLMEGRFREGEVRAAVRGLGFRFARIEHLPLSPKPKAQHLGWG